MDKIIEAINVNSQQGNVKVRISIPETCPRCKVAYGDMPKISYYVDGNHMYARPNSTYSLYFCPHCEHFFLAEYQESEELRFDGNHYGFLHSFYPDRAVEKKFPNGICTLSPNFVEIYRQAEKAENAGLLQICGLGYRKALEFLVKDYAIAFHPEDEEKIKSQMLSPCINTYVENPKVKSLAIASTWIGNDETHYVRKHEDYNLENLKAFITAVVAAIELELACQDAEKLIGPSK